jgi:hypothetical protein
MPRPQPSLRTQTKQLAHASLDQIREAAAGWLPLPEDFGRPKRHRLFSPTVTFGLFLAQILSPDGSCRETVMRFLASLFLQTGKTASTNTAAYCQARARLSSGELRSTARQLADRVEAKGSQWLWRGRRVRVADGSGLSMPDTPSNQKQWPQSSRAKPGCGFPVMRVVGLFALATGALIDLASGALTVSERTLLRSLWPLLEIGDVLLADRGFCSFADFVLLARRGVDSVMRKDARRLNAAVIERLGKNDRIVEWRKTGVRPKWMDERNWRELPESLWVREVKVEVPFPGFRTRTLWVVTTLLDRRAYPAGELARLYRRRWQVEIFFRDIKITMGMDVLRCQTPAMVEKEVWMRTIAYNLIRGLMAEAAAKHGERPERISFKGTVAALRQWAPIMARINDDDGEGPEIYAAFLYYLVKNKLQSRPGRFEPRARKRRPKTYQLLNKPRRDFREIMHRNKYRKA